jgi:hypothetical protein
MGADLYITSQYEPNNKKYRPKFEEAVKDRDSARSKAEEKRLQESVEGYFDKMLSVGYFRDSYNNSNLLWQLGLDYWTWFAGYLEDGYLVPEKAELVLAEVEARRHLLDEIEEKEERRYFEEKYEEFTEFLRTAIGLGEPIQCSI